MLRPKIPWKARRFDGNMDVIAPGRSISLLRRGNRMTTEPTPREGRAAKWILLLFLLLVAASRLLAG